MNADTQAAVAKVIEEVVGPIAARWRFDKHELSQEAWVRSLVAIRGFDPSRGTSLGGYLYQAIRQAAHEFIARSRHMVHVPCRELYSAHTAASPLDLAGNHAADCISVEEALDSAFIAATVRDYLNRHPIPDGDARSLGVQRHRWRKRAQKDRRLRAVAADLLA